MTCFIRFALLFALAGPALAFAADREFVYAQKSGVLTLDGKEIGKGYAGKGEGKNNPAMEKVRNVGPIPAGLYAISKPRLYKKMENCFDLTPDGHDALGRTEFLIHGDSVKNPGNGSEGCIILSSDIRKIILESDIRKIRVIKE